VMKMSRGNMKGNLAFFERCAIMESLCPGVIKYGKY
jgi:hypothetical protein